jgi:hypothetical protein
MRVMKGDSGHQSVFFCAHKQFIIYPPFCKDMGCE